ncbi:hypothetical protein THAOC_00605 [Thalassiosira oceanica]|uniref:Uncharacterized protein n=1 Tax=Thalassiosira oceanica TaxID=159749 RepID=K0TP09_THAOC|nr:hypothetical protein THAOC_00605 [Thalassiosira oceanica]|eukprot:EJK77556.1 hypothetical protein THAOC_00605 [Thalassiosira oceanica]
MLGGRANRASPLRQCGNCRDHVGDLGGGLKVRSCRVDLSQRVEDVSALGASCGSRRGSAGPRSQMSPSRKPSSKDDGKGSEVEKVTEEQGGGGELLATSVSTLTPGSLSRPSHPCHDSSSPQRRLGFLFNQGKTKEVAGEAGEAGVGGAMLRSEIVSRGGRRPKRRCAMEGSAASGIATPEAWSEGRWPPKAACSGPPPCLSSDGRRHDGSTAGVLTTPFFLSSVASGRLRVVVRPERPAGTGRRGELSANCCPRDFTERNDGMKSPNEPGAEIVEIKEQGRLLELSKSWAFIVMQQESKGTTGCRGGTSRAAPFIKRLKPFVPKPSEAEDSRREAERAEGSPDYCQPRRNESLALSLGVLPDMSQGKLGPGWSYHVRVTFGGGAGNVAGGAGAARMYRVATATECAGGSQARLNKGRAPMGWHGWCAGVGETDCQSIWWTGDPSAPPPFLAEQGRGERHDRAVPRSKKPLAIHERNASETHSVYCYSMPCASSHVAQHRSEWPSWRRRGEWERRWHVDDRLCHDGSARDLRPPGRGRKHNNGGAQPAQYAVFSAIVQGGGEILMVVESEQMAT